MNGWLSNISVTKKLALGFGLVLALTILLAVAGWTSLGSLIDRSDRMSDITRLNNALTALRVTRLQYMIADGDDALAQQVQTRLEEFNAVRQSLRGYFSNPSNLERLDQQDTLMQAYEQSFKSMRAAYQASRGADVEMGAKGTAATALAQTIYADISADAQLENRLAQTQASITIKDQVQLARFEVRGYTINPNDKSAQAALDQLDAALSGVDRAQPALPGERERLAQLRAALQEYRGAVLHFKAAMAGVVNARAQMTQQGNDVLRVSDELYAQQIVFRDLDSQRANTVQVSVALLALLFGVLAAWLITRQITRPLQQTMAVVARIASGDLTQTVHVERRDELGILQQGVGRMGKTLRELIGGIRDSVTQIASAAEELSAVTEQTSAGVNSQKVETDQVATAMLEMSATVQEVAQNAEQASRAATEADEQAQAGDKVVGEAIAQIELLSSEVTRSTQAMANLQGQTDKIGSVMDVIKAVAEQTNLLALNAAIEAARAGEAGRGFAVVADEVRGLAQRTQQSTTEIATLVASLQAGSQQVSKAMQSSRGLTDSSVQLTRDAGTSLAHIAKTVSGIQGMNQQIAAAAEQQSAVAEEISRSIIKVRDVAEQTAEASDETAASSVELARLGGHLQSLVGHFKV
ncbi:methyl-accepting chemotaxis protein [Pseudomonas sp. nanlin1]